MSTLNRWPGELADGALVPVALPGLRLELALRIVWRGGDDRRESREALYAIAY